MSRKKNKPLTESEQALMVPPPADVIEVEATATTEENLPVVRRVGAVISSNWQPSPLAKPVIHPEFDQLTPVVRAAEVCRYMTAKMLYTLSPGGWLFAWWRLCVVSLLALLPVIGALYLALLGISCILYPVEQATFTLRQIAVHLIIVALIAAGIGLTYFIAVTVFKGLATVAKNALLPTIFAVIFLLMAVVAGLVWLVSQFPVLERLINWCVKTT